MKQAIKIYFFVAITIGVSSSALCAQQDCSTEKVNHDCTLTIDRVNPFQPPTLQMYPNAVVTVQIKNALRYEYLSLDWQSTSGVLMPDPSSTVLSALQANLEKAEFAVTQPPTPLPAPAPMFNRLSETVQAQPVDACATVYDAPQNGIVPPTALGDVYKCAAQLALDARIAADEIAVLVNPDTVSRIYSEYPNDFSPKEEFELAQKRIICRIGGPGALDPKAGNCPQGPTSANMHPYHDLEDEQTRIAKAVNPNWTPQQTADVASLAGFMTPLVSALFGFEANLREVGPLSATNEQIGTILDPSRTTQPANSSMSCNASNSKSSGNSWYERLLQRQVSCALNAYNLVANSAASVPTSGQKKSLVVITVIYANSRIETSAGFLVSALPSRSFVATSTYIGTPPVVSAINVQENDTWPLIVPFAAAHVRLGNDWLWRDHRRGAWYATGLVGINPNTTTADLGAGLSLSYRFLMITPAAHFAHDVRLTGGFKNGEPLGTTFSGTLPTEQYIHTFFGLGLSVRIPLITNR